MQKDPEAQTAKPPPPILGYMPTPILNHNI